MDFRLGGAWAGMTEGGYGCSKLLTKPNLSYMVSPGIIVLR